MKNYCKVVALAAVVLSGYGAFAWAIRVNPTSNVMADSASTAETIIYRDASKNFAAGTGTLEALAVTAATGSVLVSTSATSNSGLCLAGAYESTPPAAGYPVGCIAMTRTPVALSGTTNSRYLYISTAVTSGVTYWTIY